MAMRTHSLLVVFAFAAGALVGVAGCENSVPPFPSYEKDVKPIMSANCIRCHGAGGTLNTDPDIPKVNGTTTPSASDFTQLGNSNGHNGLMMYAAGGPLAGAMTIFLPQMPPPPSPALGGYELDVFQAWLKNPAP
jgi:hypothetical protein